MTNYFLWRSILFKEKNEKRISRFVFRTEWYTVVGWTDSDGHKNYVCSLLIYKYSQHNTKNLQKLNIHFYF